jgi:uncharacterized protein
MDTGRTKTAKSNPEWPPSDMPCLSNKEAERAGANREKTIRSLLGKATFSFGCNKIHLGELSRGCRICGQGYWSCLFISHLCTRSCFFCPQDRNIKTEAKPREGISQLGFDDPRLYADYVRRLGYRGVSFSGGEPLLAFDKVVEYIGEVRRVLGDKVYVWLNTNGDLADRRRLRILNDAGLNEIRFNPASRDYDLRPIEVAIDCIDRVVVESPAIPEDLETLKGMIGRLEELGVANLNIHQLLATHTNYEEFMKRGYRFADPSSPGVVESEDAALELLVHAVENRIGLPINYCSETFKVRLQRRGFRALRARLARKDYEEVTGNGYIREISIRDNPGRMERIIDSLKGKNARWSYNPGKKEIYIHAKCLKHLRLGGGRLTVRYYDATESEVRSRDAEARLEVDEESARTHARTMLNQDTDFVIARKLAYCWEELPPAAVKALKELFDDSATESGIQRRFFINYGDDASIERLSQDAIQLNTLIRAERAECAHPPLRTGK